MVANVRADKGAKHNYPVVRKQRQLTPNFRGEVMNSPKRMEMAEMQLKLMGYAPPHSPLYTITYNMSRAKRYQYTDVFCINNGKLFKITKIVAYILGYKMISESKVDYYAEDMMMIRTHREFSACTKRDMCEVERLVIENLAEKMFNDKKAYNHQSIIIMDSQFEKPVEKVENHTKKSFIVRKSTEDV